MDTPTSRVRLVSHQQFREALQQASFGLGAGLAFRYDGRRDETVWTLHGEPIGLTVGRIGATTACFLATPATCMDAASRSQPTEPPALAVHHQVDALGTNDPEKRA